MCTISATTCSWRQLQLPEKVSICSEDLQLSTPKPQESNRFSASLRTCLAAWPPRPLPVCRCRREFIEESGALRQAESDIVFVLRIDLHHPVVAPQGRKPGQPWLNARQHWLLVD